MIWYVYPMWHKVSFSLIAENHVRELKKHLKIYTIDEKTLPVLSPFTNPLVVLHPYFYPMTRYSKQILYLLHRINGIIGIDVADSDKISNLAVSVTHYAEAMIVPSNFAKNAYISSGVRVPVYVVPHGLDTSWYECPKRVVFFNRLLEIKTRKRLKFLLYFFWHSSYRKGLDLVVRTYQLLRRERKDIVLVAKFISKSSRVQKIIERLGGIVITGWLTEEQKRELYDICDIYLLFSRGGGFELNGLEAISRGEIVIAAKGGAWEDYLPDFSLVKSKRCSYVLKDNPIHSGGGVEINIEKAVDKICKIADNLEKYKAKVKKHVEENIKNKFTWSNVGKMLADILRKYI